jgi:hypothetical protein
MVTRAVAAVLGGLPYETFVLAGWQKAAMTLLSALPMALTRKVVQWNSRQDGLAPNMARGLSVQRLIADRLADYQGLEGTYDHIVMGASLGGAAAHLASLLGAPFLPQPFVTSFRGGSPTDEIERHVQQSLELGEAVLGANPDVLAISHFDPIHDGWITRVITHLRLKLLGLPEGYRRFIKARLRPGGTVVYLDCGARWLQAQLGERHVLQIGGWGGIPAAEYLEGSQRIDDFLAAAGSCHRGGWGLPGTRFSERPESEWGSEPGLDAALQEYCHRQGYRFLRLHAGQPHDFSLLALRAHEELYRRGGVAPQGVVVEMFTQYDAQAALQGALLPLWLVFNTSDSLQFLKDNLSSLPPKIPLFFAGLVTFSRTPDMVPWEDWASAFQDREVMHVGARPPRYPEDITALWRGPRRLRAWVRANPRSVGARLAGEDLWRIAAELGFLAD